MATGHTDHVNYLTKKLHLQGDAYGNSTLCKNIVVPKSKRIIYMIPQLTHNGALREAPGHELLLWFSGMSEIMG